jgi:mannose-6-phosphate isomerase-like protein (cupin superfamily)
MQQRREGGDWRWTAVAFRLASDGNDQRLHRCSSLRDVHPHTDEAFYVADGDATFRLGDREVPVVAGGLVFVPRGCPHTVWNSGDRPVRGLILVSPGDAEHEFVLVERG